jgi:hypothetical protein
MKGDGLLAVEIPGFTYRLFREYGPLCYVLDGKWARAYATPSQLYYFSPRTIQTMLAAAGFRVISFVPEQASIARESRIKATLSRLHLGLARGVFKATGGKASIAGKEFYLAVKA